MLFHAPKEVKNGSKTPHKTGKFRGGAVPTGPPASNKGIWRGAGVVSGGPPKILELHYSATGFQHCATGLGLKVCRVSVGTKLLLHSTIAAGELHRADS